MWSPSRLKCIKFHSVLLQISKISNTNTYTCTHWLKESVSPSPRRQRIATSWSSGSLSWGLVNARPFKNRLKRELGPETQMTTEERSRSQRQKQVEKQLSDFCQCLDSWDWATDRCNANHPSSRICFATLFLFHRPEYLFVHITFSSVTTNCYVTAHQIFTTTCLLGAQNRHGLHQSMVTEVCNYDTKYYFQSDENWPQFLVTTLIF